MHFAKALILPIVLALTVAAAPVPTPEGNLVTLNARNCHHHDHDPSRPCHERARAIANILVNGAGSTNQPLVDAQGGDQSGSSTGSTSG
ncbi:hypothetical protein FRB91_009716 [Serendipita sp. 411]|nr:hypothetical protein FRC18_010404 [Serendipita sp. 400]KAG8849676.1 hypothetical protein FRB91_009716 [Serendipita sp. 411]